MYKYIVFCFDDERTVDIGACNAYTLLGSIYGGLNYGVLETSPPVEDYVGCYFSLDLVEAASEDELK